MTHDRKAKAWAAIGNALSYLFGAIILTLPMWFILLGII